jgi:hypothetical protein
MEEDPMVTCAEDNAVNCAAKNGNREKEVFRGKR